MRRGPLFFSLLALLSGCATPVKPIDLAWLHAGQTSRAEVRQRLGEPAHYLDGNSFMAYRICERNDENNHNLGYHGIDFICQKKVGDAKASLVVRFDAQGRYARHKLVLLKTEN